MWDNWSDEIAPEMRKRGLLIEVGGHGYENFLPPSRYFAEHPDWFGFFAGARSRDERVVFSTANEQAVEVFIKNIVAYLREHPEIDIFDCWPPDGARWSQAPEDVELGTATERHMRLLNRVAAALLLEFPNLKLEFIAYSTYLYPPEENRPSPLVLMDFCPINRSWETGLFDEKSERNRDYLNALKAWIDGAIEPRAICIYSYLTKYAWRSLPVLVPHMIGEEARQFFEMGIGGLSSYCEPGCWATYEVNHYIFSRLNWNARIDVQHELADYSQKRFGAAAEVMQRYLALVEEVVPHVIAIPGTVIEQTKQERGIARFAEAEKLLGEARRAGEHDAALHTLLDKLEVSRRYVENEMRLRLALLDAGTRFILGRLAQIHQLLDERRRIIEQGTTAGVIQGDPVRLS